MSDVCAFCRNSINQGASVCGSCGAYLSSPLREGGGLPVLFLLSLWVGWLLLGPGLLAWTLWSGQGFDNDGSFLENLGGLAFHVLFYVIGGFIVLRAISRWYSRALWYRRH